MGKISYRNLTLPNFYLPYTEKLRIAIAALAKVWIKPLGSHLTGRKVALNGALIAMLIVKAISPHITKPIKRTRISRLWILRYRDIGQLAHLLSALIFNEDNQ